MNYRCVCGIFMDINKRKKRTKKMIAKNLDANEGRSSLIKTRIFLYLYNDSMLLPIIRITPAV